MPVAARSPSARYRHIRAVVASKLVDRGTLEHARGLLLVVDAEGEYRQFVLEAANGLFRTAFVLTNDRQLAEDLVQQTLLKTWRYWRHVRDADDRYNYVRRMLLTSHIRMHRRRRVSEVLTAAPHEQDDAIVRSWMSETSCCGRSIGCRTGRRRCCCSASMRTSPSSRRRSCWAARSER